MIRAHALHAKDFTNRRYRYRGVVDEMERGRNRTKSSVRAKVEHRFHVIKRVFGFANARYRGLAKNTESPRACTAVADLLLAAITVFQQFPTWFADYNAATANGGLRMLSAREFIAQPVSHPTLREVFNIHPTAMCVRTNAVVQR